MQIKALLAVSILFLVIVFSGCTSETKEDIVELQSGECLFVQTAGKNIIRNAFNAVVISANELCVSQKDKTKGLVVSSASRTVEKQAELFYKNCLSGDGYCTTPTCNPLNANSHLVVGDSDVGYLLVGSMIYEEESKVISTIVANSKPENCPHTSNVAVDVWCEGVSGMKVDPRCQKALTEIMVKNGFCRLSSEAWHFEWNEKKLSKKEGACTQGASATYITKVKGEFKTFNPMVDDKSNECILWDYNVHKCLKIKSNASIYDGTYNGTFYYEYRDSYYIAGSNELHYTPWKQESFELTVTFKTIVLPSSTTAPDAKVSLDVTNAFSSDPNFETGSSGVNPSGAFSETSAYLPLNPANSADEYADLTLAFPNGARLEIHSNKDNAGKFAMKVSPDGKTLSLNSEWVNPIKNPGNQGYAWEAKTPAGTLWVGAPTAASGVWMSRSYNFKNWSLTKESS